MTKEQLSGILESHRLWIWENGGKRANLSGADLSWTNLSVADLSGANLSGANLFKADLSGTKLSGANLSGANLYGADLSGANLTGANLFKADLSGANLSRANLSRANLYGADLSGANLYGANLTGAHLSSADLFRADLSGAKNLFYPIACPDSGAFEAWKKCKDGVIVKLSIPAEAARSSASGRKCRAEFAIVLDVLGASEGVSAHDPSIIYRKGETVRCHKWEPNRWIECGGGVHFFITRQEAENYNP